jgi:hypothetical protein
MLSYLSLNSHAPYGTDAVSTGFPYLARKANYVALTMVLYFVRYTGNGIGTGGYLLYFTWCLLYGTGTYSKYRTGMKKKVDCTTVYRYDFCGGMREIRLTCLRSQRCV